MIPPTGHAEIDQQHDLLESTLERLATFCPEAELRPDITCDACNPIKQKNCRAILAAIADELGACLAGHAAYEEKMMELLPVTPTCQRHIKAHKAAHEAIARQLKKLHIQLADQSPRDVGDLIMRVVGHWLGEHSNHFDARLVHLGSQNPWRVDLDSELVTMLDRHVFPNRPTMSKTASDTAKTLALKKLEMRGRYESLSAAQRTVFWLVVGGCTNSLIASQLHISVNTVKTHRAAVFQKMDVKTALDLVKKADLLR